MENCKIGIKQSYLLNSHHDPQGPTPERGPPPWWEHVGVVTPGKLISSRTNMKIEHREDMHNDCLVIGLPSHHKHESFKLQKKTCRSERHASV